MWPRGRIRYPGWLIVSIVLFGPVAVCGAVLLLSGVVGFTGGITIMLLGAVIPTVIVVLLWLAPAPPEPEDNFPYCDCGYDLTGNTAGRCPECARRVHGRYRRLLKEADKRRRKTPEVRNDG